MRLLLKSIALLILSGCAGGLIELPDGTRVRQSWNANTPAEISTGEATITTGADSPQTQGEIRERSRSMLIYVGGGLIVVGVLVIGVLKYPTPGGLLIVAGVMMLTLHQYPWIGWASIILCGIGAGVYYGHEIGERKPVPK